MKKNVLSKFTAQQSETITNQSFITLYRTGPRSALISVNSASKFFLDSLKLVSLNAFLILMNQSVQRSCKRETIDELMKRSGFCCKVADTHHEIYMMMMYDV